MKHNNITTINKYSKYVFTIVIFCKNLYKPNEKMASILILSINNKKTFL